MRFIDFTAQQPIQQNEIEADKQREREIEGKRQRKVVRGNARKRVAEKVMENFHPCYQRDSMQHKYIFLSADPAKFVHC